MPNHPTNHSKTPDCLAVSVILRTFAATKMKEVIRIEKRYTSLLADSGVNRILLAAWVTLMLLMPTSCNTAEEETFMPFEQTSREAEGARLSGRSEEDIRL